MRKSNLNRRDLLPELSLLMADLQSKQDNSFWMKKELWRSKRISCLKKPRKGKRDKRKGLTRLKISRLNSRTKTK